MATSTPTPEENVVETDKKAKQISKKQFSKENAEETDKKAKKNSKQITRADFAETRKLCSKVKPHKRLTNMDSRGTLTPENVRKGNVETSVKSPLKNYKQEKKHARLTTVDSTTPYTESRSLRSARSILETASRSSRVSNRRVTERLYQVPTISGHLSAGWSRRQSWAPEGQIDSSSERSVSEIPTDIEKQTTNIEKYYEYDPAPGAHKTDWGMKILLALNIITINIIGLFVAVKYCYLLEKQIKIGYGYDMHLERLYKAGKGPKPANNSQQHYVDEMNQVRKNMMYVFVFDVVWLLAWIGVAIYLGTTTIVIAED